mmetsp:Transcript_14663/g.55483  ORF Transcript_14663/g.55483 Transcript_14663/m.55483 type:complete len:206 (+) Transcript_14663:4621-5238(+)
MTAAGSLAHSSKSAPYRDPSLSAASPFVTSLDFFLASWRVVLLALLSRVFFFGASPRPPGDGMPSWGRGPPPRIFASSSGTSSDGSGPFTWGTILTLGTRDLYSPIWYNEPSKMRRTPSEVRYSVRSLLKKSSARGPARYGVVRKVSRDSTSASGRLDPSTASFSSLYSTSVSSSDFRGLSRSIWSGVLTGSFSMLIFSSRSLAS